MTHADKVREAEREVVEAAVEFTTHPDRPLGNKVDAAVDALLALRAATCPTCGGSGYSAGPVDNPYRPGSGDIGIACRAGRDAGRRRDAS